MNTDLIVTIFDQGFHWTDQQIKPGEKPNIVFPPLPPKGLAPVELSVLDRREGEPILSTNKIKDITFETTLPGGFGTASFVLPKMYFISSEWEHAILGRLCKITDAGGELAYEGTVEGVEEQTDGLTVQCIGYYAQASFSNTWLVFPDGQDTPAAIRELCNKVSTWNPTTRVLNYMLISCGPRDLRFDVKVQEAIEDLLKIPIQGAIPPLFYLYEDCRPYYGWVETYYRASLYNMTATYGESLSLTGMWNKIQAVYDKDGKKENTDYVGDYDSQEKYGVREGTLNVGSVSAAVADLALDLAVSRLSHPTEKQKITLQGQVFHQLTGNPMPVWKVRAGSYLHITDLPSHWNSRDGWFADRDFACFFIASTNYSHNDRTLTIEVGDGVRSLESYLNDIGISGGSVK